MIKNTTLTFSKKDAKIMIRLLDIANGELNQDKDERGKRYKYFDEASIKRFSNFSYQYSAPDVTEIIIKLTHDDEEV
jgi:hypothetical protein